MLKTKSIDLEDKDVETRKIEELKEKLKKIKERELKLFSKIQKQSQQSYERVGNESKNLALSAPTRSRPFSASGSLKSPLQRQSLGSSLFAVPKARLPPSLQIPHDSETTPKKSRYPMLPDVFCILDVPHFSPATLGSREELCGNHRRQQCHGIGLLAKKLKAPRKRTCASPFRNTFMKSNQVVVLSARARTSLLSISLFLLPSHS